MKKPVLDADKIRIIRLQAETVRRGSFFLAGGTGLAIRCGHRISKDLDWFTSARFDAEALKATLLALPEAPTVIEQQGAHTLRAYYGRLETSFIAYQQVPPQTELVKVAGAQIPIANLELMAIMKAAAVHDRGTKRDFIDIHTICSQPGWSVPTFITVAARNLPLEPEQMALALTYFADAERDPMPDGYSTSWARVKGDISRGVRGWEISLDRSR